jgi:excisionase family DNA binding protein
MPDLLVTVAQAAELWGVSKSTVWRMIERGEVEIKRFSARCVRVVVKP